MGQSITSANAKFTLIIPGVYSSGVLLDNFAVDDMFEAEEVELTESRIGADGQAVGGYVFNMTNMPINFQANSDGILVFQAWKQAQDSQRDIIVAQAAIIMPALGLKAALNDGFLGPMPAFPPHKKVAENWRGQIRWGSWQIAAMP